MTDRLVINVLILTSMPRTEIQFEQIREVKRKLIIDAAMVLFAEKGYYNTSINEIAKNAGISKGLVYNYFKSKEDLLKKIMISVATELSNSLDANQDGTLEKHELLNYIETLFKQIRYNFKFWKFYFAIINQPVVMRIVEKEIIEIAKPTLKMIVEYFKVNGYKQPEIEAAFFVSLLNGVCHKYLSAPELFPLEQVKKKIIKMYSE